MPGSKKRPAVAERRARIIEAIREGKLNKVIAWELGMNPATVATDIFVIRQAAGARNKWALTVQHLTAEIERLRTALVLTHQSVVIGDSAETVLTRIDEALIPEMEG